MLHPHCANGCHEFAGDQDLVVLDCGHRLAGCQRGKAGVLFDTARQGYRLHSGRSGSRPQVAQSRCGHVLEDHHAGRTRHAVAQEGRQPSEGRLDQRCQARQDELAGLRDTEHAGVQRHLQIGRMKAAVMGEAFV